jgi:hypothetical protein
VEATIRLGVETYIALACFISTILILRWYFVRMGKLSFWKVAALYLDDFFEHMDKDDTWIYSSGKAAKPSDEYVGPFYFAKDGQTYKIYALSHQLEQSQNDFMSKYGSLATKKPFPVISSLFFLYPILSMLSLSNSSITTIVGYGFTNLGYLLAAAGVIGGSYRALGLDHRIQVFSAAIIFFLAGLFLFNF